MPERRRGNGGSRQPDLKNLLLHLAVRQPPERHQRQRSQRRSQLWRPPSRVLELLRADLLGPHLHLRPIHRIGEDHHRMVVGQRDRPLLGAGEQVGLTAAATASSSSFGRHGPAWSQPHEPQPERSVDPCVARYRNDPAFADPKRSSARGAERNAERGTRNARGGRERGVPSERL